MKGVGSGAAQISRWNSRDKVCSCHIQTVPMAHGIIFEGYRGVATAIRLIVNSWLLERRERTSRAAEPTPPLDAPRIGRSIR